MATIARDEVKKVIRGNVAGLATDTFETENVPAGQKWQISSVVFADQSVGDGKSGAYSLEWGAPGAFDLVEAAYLTGNTWCQELHRVFTGDGTKRFRVRRQNTSALPKDMVVIISGFKRIGG